MDLLIDQRIRDWVLLPLVLMMLMVGLFRHYLTQYNQNTQKTEKITSQKQYKTKSE